MGNMYVPCDACFKTTSANAALRTSGTGMSRIHGMSTRPRQHCQPTTRPMLPLTSSGWCPPWDEFSIRTTGAPSFNTRLSTAHSPGNNSDSSTNGPPSRPPAAIGASSKQSNAR
eukprot:261725-Chlamydomonas_euryale.AAC.2